MVLAIIDTGAGGLGGGAFDEAPTEVDPSSEGTLGTFGFGWSSSRGECSLVLSLLVLRRLAFGLLSVLDPAPDDGDGSSTEVLLGWLSDSSYLGHPLYLP